MQPELSAEVLRRARESGRYMRETHKARSSVPMFAMGEAGRLQHEEWEAGWDQRDYEMKRGIAARPH